MARFSPSSPSRWIRCQRICALIFVTRRTCLPFRPTCTRPITCKIRRFFTTKKTSSAFRAEPSAGLNRKWRPITRSCAYRVRPKKSSFCLLPFTPNKRDNMRAWLAARSDPPHYGKLIALDFPKAKLIYGAKQIEARIDQDAFISQQLSLWGQRGSQVIRGSLLAIPIETSLLYVQPLYLAAEKGSLPELKRVIVAFGNQIAMEETLEQSLQRI